MDLPLIQELTPALNRSTRLRALQHLPDVLLLESARRGQEIGRFSFLVADPFQFHKTQRASFRDDPFQSLSEQLKPFQSESIKELPPFQGGAAGLLSYGLGAAWERLPQPRRDEFCLPDTAIGIYDWVIAWDHTASRAWIISQGFPEIEISSRKKRAAARRDEVPRTLDAPSNHSTADQSVWPVSAEKLVPQYPAPGPTGMTSNFTQDGYLQIVQRAIDYIYAGDIFQVNLSQRLLIEQRLPTLELYARLRACNAAPFAGYFAHDDWTVVGRSPERFVSLRENQVSTRPIKGTRQRQRLPEADLFTRDELRESDKDQAENVMIVDLLRNDLSRVCQPGTIHVPELCRVESYETVQHLVSEVRGTLAAGQGGWDVFRVAFPGGSITGAPKVRAMEIIGELEPTARGPYCGCLFYVGFDGNMDSSILIRTFTVREGWIQCPVGGGIVAQSSPIAEYEETLHKAEGMLRAFA